MEFRVLGPLQVIGGVDRPVALGGAQQRAVLALMLVRAPEPVSLDRLIDELWGEQPPPTAQHAVQVHVSGIRKVLRAGGGGVAVLSSASGYLLDLEPERFDVRRFERLLGEARRVLADDPSCARELFEGALELWRGPPLAEFSQFAFARSEADRLQELRAVGIEGLVDARLACGEHAEVIATITGLVAANPLREGPRRLLMLALYRCGRHAEALAAYRDACAALDEIGLQPGPELRQLEQNILRHNPSLRDPGARSDVVVDEDPPEASVTASGEAQRAQPRIPAAAHPLVGRVSEMSTLTELLSDANARLVTLVGPGGCGKTRLALEAARRIGGRFADGAAFVPLAALTDPALVVSEIARALGVRESESQPLPAALADAVSSSEILLVLDNFEHVMAAAGIVSQLLTAAPRLNVLVTSREALNLTGEHRIELEGLPIQDAAALFVERARAVRREFDRSAPQNEAIERLCRRLDGLPLALELAAARIALFSVSALETRLAQRLDLPEGARDLPERQRTLRATIDWSYQLLSPQEQLLFRELAPFAGGARLDAIEASTTLNGALIATVGALLDKSLLRRRDDADGESRFWMLETVREFASEFSREGDGGAVADRHARYFLALAEQAEPQLYTSEQGDWLRRLEAEQDNLRVAFDHLITHDPPSALRIASALGRFWQIGGFLSEGRERLARALAAAPADGAVVARANVHAGHLASLKGDFDEAERLLWEGLALARQAGTKDTEGRALSLLGSVVGTRDVARSVELHEQALEVAREAGDDWTLLSAATNLGATLNDTSEKDRARVLLHEALASSRRIGDISSNAVIAADIAEAALAGGNLDEAEAILPEAVRCAELTSFDSVLGWIRSLEALVAIEREQLPLAERSMRESLALLGHSYDFESGRVALAVAATLAAARGEAILAARLWAALAGSSSDRRLEVSLVTHLRDHWLARSRDQADEAEWEAAWATGLTLRPEQALELARLGLAGSRQ